MTASVLYRHNNSILNTLDSISYLLYYPWTTCFSFIITCYVSKITEKQEPQKKIIDYFLLGPLCAALLILLLPLGLLGIFMWLILCSTCIQEKYTLISNPNSCRKARVEEESSSPEQQCRGVNTFTFCTANVLLGPECLNHLNNNTSAYIRAPMIAQRLLHTSGSPLTNLGYFQQDTEYVEKLPTLRDSVVTIFPSIDFLCLQEVWERFHAKVLIKYLEAEYPYILYDVGEYKWNVNYCLFGSGLMFASKKPILAADFRTYSYRTQHAKVATQGILCVKVLMGYSSEGHQNIGFISNLHTQAFQGNEPCIARQLSESLAFIKQFQENSLQRGDSVIFDVICGDFNADNMSPADIDVQNHEIFSSYYDPCCVTSGVDQPWAIGTELRQAMLHAPQLSSPHNFRKSLINPSLRRKFVLDADVLIHSHELMTSVVEPGPDGTIPIEPFGGMRRVDRLLLRQDNDSSARVLGYAFGAALTNLTDHLPVCMTVGVPRM